jgi:hypothetical protein
MLQAVGLSMILVEDDTILERLKTRRIPRVRPALLRAARNVVLTQDFLRSIGAKGGRGRAQKLSEKRLSQIAVRANRIRWAKHRRNVANASATEASQPALVFALKTNPRPSRRA